MSVERLVSVLTEVEKYWKEIKEKFDLKDVECSLTLRIEKDKITLK